MKRVIRWGLAGSGPSVHEMARTLRTMPDAQLIAALGDDAREISQAYGIPRAYRTVEDFVRNPDMDVVYIASGLAAHAWLAMKAFEAGKAVLCQRPISEDLLKTRRVVDSARKYGKLLVEGVWPFFLPTMSAVRLWLNEERIGRIVQVQATLGQAESAIDEPRGALIDAGLFGVHLAAMVYCRAPGGITALAEMGRGGIDLSSILALRFPGGGMATITALPRPLDRGSATISGTRGAIRLLEFERTTRVELQIDGQAPQRVEYPIVGSVLRPMADAIMQAVREGARECPEVTWAQSLDVMRVLDEARRQIGCGVR